MSYHLISACLSSVDNGSIAVQLECAMKRFVTAAHPQYDSVDICTSINAKSKFGISHELYRDCYQNLASYSDFEMCTYPRSWIASGCWRWKPALIRNACSIYPQDSILIYHDVNLLKFPVYESNISANPHQFSQLMGANNVLLFSEGYKPVYLDIKKYMLDEYGFTSISHLLHVGFWSGMIAVRNNEMAKQFLDLWLSFSTEKNFFPLPDVPPSTRYKGFVHHSSCQAGLALAYYKSVRPKIKIAVAFSSRSRCIHDYRVGLLGYILSLVAFVHLFHLLKCYLLALPTVQQSLVSQSPLASFQNKTR